MNANDSFLGNNRRSALRAIIFDMDGLMIDSETIYWAVERRMARSFGKEASDQTLGSMMGRSPLDSMATIAVPSQYTNWQDFSFVDYSAKNLKDAAAHLHGSAS